jgi:hypothetical protein
MTRVTVRRSARAAWALVLLGAAGCGPRGDERYVPAEPVARQALEAALRAWQDGRPPGQFDSAAAPVMVVDSGRRPGQRLRGHDILGEVHGDGPRCFAVRLLLDNPPEERKARYVVFGISPLWVFRQEDYETMAHWGCGGTTEKGPAATPAVPQ